MSRVPNLGNETSGYHPSPSKFKTPQEILTKYSKFMNDVQVTRVVVALCEHTFFGVSVKCYNISMYVLNTSFGLNAMLHTCSFSL